ncbi:MAG: flagellar filament capping protein FliD [Proteobacteria bacterium]|nr:flagellar filament capping protein FliD [Pseudomonadota bacterium]
MATISSLGLGSGLDSETIVSKLVALEKQPITDLQTAAGKLQTKLSSFGKIQSYLDSLNSAASALNGSTLWRGSTASSSNSSAVQATSSTGSSAGAYAVNVSQLASSQMAATGAWSSSTSTVGAGTLSFDIGSWNADATSFSASGSTVSIDIEATDTLENVRDKINAVDNLGVSASIVNDANGARLVLKSDDSGTSHGFRVQVSDGDGNNADAAGLSMLAYDPANGAGVMTRTQAAQNAKGSINGLEVESETNSLSNVIDGVSLTFGSVTTSAVSVTVSNDTDSMKSAVNSFVNAYNGLMGYLRDQTKYVEGSTSTNLQGDRTAIGLQQQVRSILAASSSASSAFVRASEIGLDVQKDGTIKLNDAKLSSALAKPDELRKFFGADGATAGEDGLTQRVADVAKGWLDVDGSLTARQQGLQKLIDINQDRQDAMQKRVDAMEKRLRAQYSALDTSMSQLSTLQNYVEQQITNWNKS